LATQHFSFGRAAGCPVLDVGADAGGGSQARDEEQGSFGLMVAAAVAMVLDLSGGFWIALTPHSAANDASPVSRPGLSPTPMSRVAALF